jgi:phage FluMu gp28-like protein
MTPISLKLPRPHAGQVDAIRASRKYNVVCCGRRWGKSVLGTDRIIAAALQGLPAAWFAPNYKYLLPIWRRLKQLLKPVTRAVNEQEKRIELLTGGEIEMWTLDGPDPALGRKYALVVVDEAAIAVDLSRLWQTCIEPTLLDLNGGAWFLSTPRGYNYFHVLALMAQDPVNEDWAYHHAPTVSNPTIPGVAAWVARKKQTTDRDTFTQEYEAEFIRGGGAVFRAVIEAATARAQESAASGHEYVCGLDFGRSGDFTVMSVIDVTTGEQVFLDRYTGVEFVQQQHRIKALHDRFLPSVMICEANSFGQANIEALQRLGLPVLSFTTTQATKALLIDNLALAFEQRAIRILSDPVQKGELLAFESRKSANGLTSYSAPSGMHDDTVIALALAVKAATRQQAPQSLPSFW